jgi:hypothetical protein
MDDDTLDKLAICDVLDQWVIWSDAGDWERFRTVWHDDGWMNATWFQGPADEFVDARRGAWERNIGILHFQGGSTIDLAGTRAIAQTKMQIHQRGDVHGVECDMVCTGRFYDFFEKRDGRWGVVLRQPIYEKDRLDPIDPAAELKLDPEILARFPEGYCYLAYFQVDNGFTPKPDQPGLKGPEIAALYEIGASWLAGQPLPESIRRRYSQGD